MPSRREAVAALKACIDGLERHVVAAPFTRSSGVNPVLEHLGELEAALTAKGWPAMSSWWLDVITLFYSRRCRRFIARVGRRGGKSTTWCRVAVLEALYGLHKVPPGDVGVVAIVSVDRREAARRLRTIRQILDALGVAYGPIDGGIQLATRPIAFQVFTASIAGVSGFTSIFVFCDEVAKWKDADTGANPATEVLASLRPTMKTMPNARMVLSSSPMGVLDAHADAFGQGDSEAPQMVAHAPTWVANPTITEADTHAEEPDELLWKREYAALPLEDFETSVYTTAILDRATRAALVIPPEHGWTYIATTDPATRGNGWSLIVRTTDMKGLRIIVLSFEWRGTPSKPLDPEDVFREMAEKLKPYGVRHVHQDMHSFDAQREHRAPARPGRQSRLRLDTNAEGGDVRHEPHADGGQPSGAAHEQDAPVRPAGRAQATHRGRLQHRPGRAERPALRLRAQRGHGPDDALRASQARAAGARGAGGGRRPGARPGGLAKEAGHEQEGQPQALVGATGMTLTVWPVEVA